MAYFLAKAGADMQHIPMKSTGDAVNEVLAGRVQGVTSSLIGIAAFKGDPRLKTLAYTGTTRSRFMPDLPTVAEAGVPGYKFDSWIGLLAPAGTPQEVQDKIAADVRAVLSDEAVKARFVGLGGLPRATSPQEFSKLIADDRTRFAQIIRSRKITVE